MKLGKTVLLEIIDIVRCGITNGTDISQMLRDIEVYVPLKQTAIGFEGQDVELSQKYVDSHREYNAVGELPTKE